MGCQGKNCLKGIRMTLPNFFIIGAAKSGTSSLYMYLNQHPEIYMSPIKEPHFFSYDSVSKMTSGPGDTINQAITNLGSYKQLFSGVKAESAIGEASTSYLYRPEAAKRIHDMIPSAKLIVVLRNPTERAFSAYMHVVRDQRESARNFKEALSKETKRTKENWDPIWHFTKVGYYHEQLTRYYNLFPKEQIKVYLYDELVENPQMLLCDLFKFLSVDPNFAVDISVRFNVSGEQKSKIIHYLSNVIFLHPNPLRWISRKFIPERWRWKFTNWIRDRNLMKHDISPQERKELMHLFKEDILQLQDLIEMDLSIWLE